ncbi:polysaccharide deacetylase family protein [Alteribacillus sp. JSM 102045]|uniref:polysaccharide deacetylase family protein n=1 Tax=Alteribacillus sp. JSM 102045 TaxID=1562101 RepID=UPI0035BFFE56
MYGLKDERWIKNADQIGMKGKKVILTFDDGPSRQLNAILDVLKEKKVPAVFFWQSKILHAQRPWKRVIQEGHEIGSHAHNHKNLTSLTKGQQYKQIKMSVEVLQKITGTNVKFFRPPFGQYNEDTMNLLKTMGLTPVMWEITSYDWKHKSFPGVIIRNVVDHLKEGAIILLHEVEQTLFVLPELIDRIRAKGYEFTFL